MPIRIPESVFQKYYDVIDSTITNIFGIDCTLVYVQKVEEIANTYDNIPPNKSINAHRQNTGDYKREDKTYKEVETRETIRLKVYWDSKAWVKAGGDIVVPENSIQNAAFYSDNYDSKEVVSGTNEMKKKSKKGFMRKLFGKRKLPEEPVEEKADEKAEEEEVVVEEAVEEEAVEEE